MKAQKTDNTSFKSFYADQTGKKFLSSLYAITEPKAHQLLTNELRLFRQTVSEHAQKVSNKGYDLVFTSADPHNPGLKWPALQFMKEGKLSEDTANTPSQLFILEMDYRVLDKKWNKAEVKKVFTQAKQEIKKWFTISYIDRYSDNSKSINTLKNEAQAQSSPEQIIDAIF